MNAPKLSSATAFEGWLEDKGFSRSRAKAITAKGFRAADMEAAEASEVADMVAELKRRQVNLKNRAEIPQFVERFLEMTSSVGNRVRLFPGDSKEITIPNVKLGKLKVNVEAPKFADWTCEFTYYDFKGRVPVRRRETLFMKKGQYRNNISVDRGRPPAFNPFSLQDWKRQFPEQLVLDTTRAKFTYLKFDDPSIDDLPQHQSTFSISVRSE